MKKEYFAPKMVIVKIKTKQLLTASGLGYGGSVTSASGAEAREYEFDDFDDFDE